MGLAKQQLGLGLVCVQKLAELEGKMQGGWEGRAGQKMGCRLGPSV